MAESLLLGGVRIANGKFVAYMRKRATARTHFWGWSEGKRLNEGTQDNFFSTLLAIKQPLKLEDAFEVLFSADQLHEVFRQRFANSPAKGCDRLNGFQFEARAKGDLEAAARKLISGRFRFSPYLESLKIKGRDRNPRMVSIPTIRDRIVLNQLKTYLALAFPEFVPKNIASGLIREVTAKVRLLDPQISFACGCDVKDFYGSIQRARIEKIVATRVLDPRARTLVHR